MIIKAQRSLNRPDTILIYDRERSIFQELADTALSTAIGDRQKAYFEVKIGDDGIMRIKKEVKANW